MKAKLVVSIVALTSLTAGCVTPLDRDAVVLDPGWPGFAVNTIFYATLLWLPFPVRRFIRIRRGLCPACAYPMAESDVCSECGNTLPGRREAMT